MKPAGFSIIEALIAIAVIAILAGIIIFSFSGVRDSQVLHAGAEEIVTLLTSARSKTLASLSNSQWGVYFEEDKMTLFRGDSFPGVGDPDNQEVSLDALLSISDVTLSGGANSVVFERLSGRTNQVGTITVSLDSGAAARVIRIGATGLTTIE